MNNAQIFGSNCKLKAMLIIALLTFFRGGVTLLRRKKAMALP